MIDLAIRKARIYDGSGMPAFQGAVGIDGGRVVSVGGTIDEARQVIDADGLALAPGFVDPHTHYDPQLFWDGRATPSMEHGVTSVVTGNCSLSLAPVRPGSVKRLGRMFGKIEELPSAAFDEGIPWTWESFPQYLTELEPRLALNVAPLVGHSPLRMWVMGDEASERAATPDEVGRMQQVLRESLVAGGAGLSISYVDIDENNKPVPSRLADADELRALAAVLGDVGGRVLQVVPEYWSTPRCAARVDQLAELSLAFGIPTTFSPLMQQDSAPDLCEVVMARVRQHAGRGARVVPQVQTRPNGSNFHLDWTVWVANRLPLWKAFSALPTKEARLAQLTDPASRRALVADLDAEGSAPSAARARLAITTVLATKLQRNRSLVGRKVVDIAAERGTTPIDLVIDLSLEEDLATEFQTMGVSHNDVEVVGSLLADPLVLVGASDAGAHIRTFASTGDTGYLFSKFVRECGYLGVAEAVRRITSEPAALFGMFGRGVLRPGAAGDFVLFDPDTLDRGRDVSRNDLPGGGQRYLRGAVGVHTVGVNGVVTYTAADGYTDALPGVIASRWSTHRAR